MVLTAAQTANFFEQANQMAIPLATLIQLGNEGILTVGDLVDFDKDSLAQIASNLRRPGGRIPDPTPGAAAGATIPTPPFVFGAKSQARLEVACDLIRFYETIGRPLTAANIAWQPIMRHFGEIWKSMVARKEAPDPETPKISKGLPIMKWTESFRDHLHQCYGMRTIPLAYVIRDDPNVTGPCPALKTDQPFSEQYGSVDEDLIHRASHTHGLFRDDNASVYFKLEEATRGTSYADTIKPFQRKKDGRAAFTALISQYAGVDKWENIIRKHDNILHTRKWRGQGNFSLEQFVQIHRSAFVAMKAAAEHVSYQLPNEHTRVTYLIDAIENDDAGLQAAIASVEADNSPNSKRKDFELCAAHLLPKDPVLKKRTQSKRPSAEISASESEQKCGIGKTGVHYRFHTPEEYDKLNAAQKRELALWRVKNPTTVQEEKASRTKRKRVGKGGRGGGAIAAAVKQALENEKKKREEAKTSRDDDRKYIMSLLNVEDTSSNMDIDGDDDDEGEKKPAAKISLSSILKKSKS